MCMDKGTLLRLAASCLGEAGCVQGTPMVEALEDCVQHAVSLALDYTHWDFALEMVVLPMKAGMAMLPADCLEVREVQGMDHWRKKGRWLVNMGLPVESVTLWYKSSKLADTVSLPDYEPFFCEGVVLLLAAKAAPRVSSNFNLSAELEQRAYKALYRAKLKEARAAYSNDQKPSTEELWASL